MSSDTEKDIQKEELHADPDLAALVVPLPLPANRPKTVVTSPADLPTELLLNIFKHLPAKDVVSLSLVCRKFYRCSNDSSVWFSLCQTGGGRETVGARDGRRKGGNNSVPRAAKVDWKLEFRWRYGRWRVYDANRESGSAGHKGIVWGVQYDEENERVFTASADGTIKIFEPHPVPHPYLGEQDEFRCKQTIQAYQGLATKMDPSVFGASLAIRRLSAKALLTSWEGYLRVLDIEYGRFLATWLAHEKTVTATSTIRQGGTSSTSPWLVATGSADRSIRLFDLRTPPKMRRPSPFYSGPPAPAQAVLEFKNLEGTVLCLSQQRSNDNVLAAGGRFKSISLFDLRNPAGMGSSTSGTEPASGAFKHLFVGSYTYALCPDPLFGNCIYSGSGDRRGAILDRWQLDSEVASSSGHLGLVSRLRGPQTPHRSFISAIASRDDGLARVASAGGTLVTASWDGTVVLWDPAATCSKQERGAVSVPGDASPTTEPLPTTSNDPKVRRTIVRTTGEAIDMAQPQRHVAALHGQSASFTGLALGKTRILASHFGGVACLDLSPRHFHRVTTDESYQFSEQDVWEDEDEEDDFHHVGGREWPSWMRPGYGMRGILGRMVSSASAAPPTPHGTTVSA